MANEQEPEALSGDAATRISALSHARDLWLYRLITRSTRAVLRVWYKRYLASLSDRQLNDAGIDLSLAGRGRASDARQDPNLEGLR